MLNGGGLHFIVSPSFEPFTCQFLPQHAPAYYAGPGLGGNAHAFAPSTHSKNNHQRRKAIAALHTVCYPRGSDIGVILSFLNLAGTLGPRRTNHTLLGLRSS